MAEYIEREKVLAICDAEYQKRLLMLDYCGDTVAWNIGGEIRELPAADVAPVVRCKDCTCAELYEGSEGLYCMNIAGLCTYVMDDDYCSYGVRKDSAERSGT